MLHHIRESIIVKEKILNDETFLKTLEEMIGELKEVYQREGKVLIAGNGGSASDAQHFAAEITCQYKEIRKGYPALALHTDTSALTAWGNDKSFETVYKRQVEAHGKGGDVLIVISTSGNSGNLISAAEQARAQSIRVFGLLGRDGGKLLSEGLCDRALVVPSSDTPRIQESHILLIHIICDALDHFFVEQEKE